MNHKQRRKVRATLLAYRRKTQRAPEDIAGQLGWPVAFYHEAESGKVGLSKGQADDVRSMIKKEIASATVRDRLLFVEHFQSDRDTSPYKVSVKITQKD